MVYLDEDTRINSDVYQYILEKRSIAKSGKNEGQEIQTSESFHPNISSLLESILKKKLFGVVKKKDMHSLEEFIEALNKEIKKFDKIIKESVVFNSKVLPEIKKKEKETTKQCLQGIVGSMDNFIRLFEYLYVQYIAYLIEPLIKGG